MRTFLRFQALLPLCIVALPALGLTDELDDIQQARETAEIQYVNELATGKYKTQRDKDALRAKYLDPQEQRTREYFKKISTGPASTIHPAPESPSGDSDSEPTIIRSNASQEHSGLSSSGGDQALDGTYVPKEIVFEPVHRVSPKPSPQPTPKPSSAKKR